MLERILYGWEKIEAALVASIALGWPVILQGRHGIAKSTAIRAIAAALGEECRIYIAPVEDLITVAGLPNPKALADGKFEFTPHARAIWEASIVGIDELPRAPKETQNLFLEVLQEGTLMGKPLRWQVVLATMNPDTYAASHRLDAALGDRFYMVLPIPEHQEELNEQEREALLNVALTHDVSIEELAARISELPQVLAATRARFEELAGGLFRTRAVDFCSRLLTLCLRSEQTYISPRRQAMLVRAIMGIAAARMSLGEERETAVRSAAEDALLYVLSVPLGIAWTGLKALCDDLAQILEGNFSELDQFKYELAQRTGMERLQLMKDNRDTFLKLPPDEREKLLGQVLEAEGVDILCLQQFVQSLPGHEELKRRSVATMAAAYDAALRKIERQLGSFTFGDEEGKAKGMEWAAILRRYRERPISESMIKAVLATSDDMPCSEVIDNLRKAIEAGDNRSEPASEPESAGKILPGQNPNEEATCRGMPVQGALL